MYLLQVNYRGAARGTGGVNGRYHLERRAWSHRPLAGRPDSSRRSGTIFPAPDAHLYAQSTVPPRIFVCGFTVELSRFSRPEVSPVVPGTGQNGLV